MRNFDQSKKRIADFAKHLPGGVNSNFRMGISPTPLVFERASGPHLYDVDGNRLIDYYLGMGPMILGHNPEPVLTAVVEQLKYGILYAGQSEIEFEAARRLCEIVPCAEMVRFSCAGSEVVQAALRLARAATGRSIIIKFEGHYHGWLDNVLWSIAPTPDQFGPEEAPTPVPASAGQDLPAGQHTEVLPWNNLNLLAARLKRGDVAAVIMEPAMCNTGAITPAEDYLEGVRDVCSETGTILIFDEIITGFRLAPGGAQQRFGVTPDLATFGKAIANGFPVSALAGRADLMEQIASGGVLHGGSYNAQPAAMAAVVATLGELTKPETFTRLEEQGQKLMTGIEGALADADIEAQVQGFPQIFHVALGVSSPITNYRDSLAADKARYIDFTTALLEHGIRVLERGAWFLSTAHNDAVIDETIAAVATVAKAL
ncbi:MAG: aspartate aminotransferase family protein [Candidatus Poribacteria bacterium]|nr:aspartate aminotransferase family protein [Candidatus Poribacteria bacterium]